LNDALPVRGSIGGVRESWALGLVLVACALIPYAGTWSYGFVDYDDVVTIVDMPLIRELSWRTLPNFFRPDVYPGLHEYAPLKNLSFAVDYALAGLSPGAMRVQQQLWYVLNVLLLWGWLRMVLRALAAHGRLGLSRGQSEALAFATALLFALHPVHVESVTWLTGRKDVLAGAFMMATLLTALRWQPVAGRPRPGMLVAAWLCCALALLSKQIAMVLPLLLFLQDYVCGESSGRLTTQLRQRAPLYLGTALLCAASSALYFTILAPPGIGITDDTAARLYTGAAYARWGQQLLLFASLSLWPSQLAPYYPSDLLDPALLSMRGALGAGALALSGAATAWAWRRRHPLLLPLGLFSIPLLPVLIAPQWAQYVAGRYLHTAVAGLLLALAWAGACIATWQPRLRGLVAGAGVLLALALALNTLTYNRTWRDSVALWQGAIDVYPRFTDYYPRAARAAFLQGKHELALATLYACVEIDEGDGPCNALLGRLLLPIRPDEAERRLARALPNDRDGEAHLALALHLAATGKPADAVKLYERWLNGKFASQSQVEGLGWLALEAKQYRKAYDAVQQTVRAGALNHPAGSPPRKLLLAMADARGDAAWSAKLQDALASCNRVDCVRQRLGW
jgi:protein O-mannosyl-transferase